MKKLLLLTAAACLPLAGCDDKKAAANAPAPAAQAAPQVPGYAKKATYFRLPGAAGGEVDLSAYAGRPVMVIFFTETCPYCRKAAPFIQKISTAYAQRGLGVVGICVQDSAQAALNYGKDFGLTFPLAYNGKEVSRNYKTQGVPYIYLLKKDHEIYDVWEGYDPQYDGPIVKAVETLLAQG